jgi:beta-glucanase (GH16 family)
VLGGPAGGDDWELVWSDEFSTPGRPDPAKWGYEEGFIRNHEKQSYSPKNARVEDGKLVIEAKKEAPGDGKPAYTSASLTTQGKASWTYGKVEVRAKLPTGRGTWPAIWMLGTNIDEVGWPRCGEIDIMENVGFDPDTIHFNVHTAAYNHVRKTNKGTKVTLAKPYDDFHVYGIEWTPKAIDFFLDGKTTFTFDNNGKGSDAWPYDRPQYLILNLAIGGDWGGQKGIDTSIFPQRMEVDYVRVYQKPSAEAKKETPR